MCDRLLPNRTGLTPHFFEEVHEFVQFACKQPQYANDKENSCPCSKDQNRKLMDLDHVDEHIYKYGFMEDYWYWTSHGESKPVEFDSHGTDSTSHFTTLKPNEEAKEISHENEVAALLKWKASLDNKSQSLLSSWATTTYTNAISNPCNNNWFGIGCNKAGRVAYLNLTSCDIRGYVPQQIGLMRELVTLDLGFNSITGMIPSTIFGNLSDLYFLAFPKNELRGYIPSSIGNLTKLEILYLYKNRLSGPIPEEIGMLKSIRDLELFDNHLTGHIPSSIGNLSNLTILYLRVNNLTGRIPEEFGMLNSLYDIDLGVNNLEGDIPSSIGNLEQLTYLALYENNLTGNILINLKNCTNLYRIDLRGNKFSENISETFGIYLNLDYIDLSDNRFHGELDATWGLCRGLTGFKISNNYISGNIPDELGGVFESINGDNTPNF
ncbi:hypothetical protein ACH5RR_026633 [Cinchona calisaya]|uniref:Leucine-rich repeat-containing N-terminal plant-type domain-containing protein n=1 Tax=Cinchona calisaya TaxID=153742 RepID=A0ABD2Z398_9GENT